MSRCVILLTGCINPDGMPLTSLTDTSVRERQYYEAIDFYLSHTTIPVVFTENSGTKLDIPNSSRFEQLCFYGNKDKTHGKGYGECEIIDYALNNSNFIREDTTIIKITGRLIIRNIMHIIRQAKIMPGRVLCSMHSNMVFADSRIISCPYSFLNNFVCLKEQINDFQEIYFETILASTLHTNKSLFFPFIIEPQICGTSGSTGQVYTFKKKRFKEIIRYIRYQLSLFIRFNKNR